MSSSRPKRSLGQNFLVDKSIARRIVEASCAPEGAPLLEIGPGRGALTALLARRGGSVSVLEKDDGLVERLRDRDDLAGRVQILHDDAMRISLDELAAQVGQGQPVHVVANLPYNIASRIALRFLAWEHLADAVFLFQREVALRFAAPPGSREYGGLSVIGRIYADPFLLFPVPPEAFRPRPKVQSHLVRFRPLSSWRIPPDEVEWFEFVVRGVFRTRRKTLANSLRYLPDQKRDAESIDAVLTRCGIEADRRAETLSFDEYAELARALA